MPTDFDDIMRRTMKGQEPGTNSVASVSVPTNGVQTVTASAANVEPVASATDSFSPTSTALDASVKKQTPATVNADDGYEATSKVVKETEISEIAPAKSEAVQLQELQNENALRMKGLEIALGLWKEQRADENKLRDREMQFDLWKRQHDIEAADRKIEKLSGARDVKWTYHGTFANGVLTSTFSGSSTNPYKEVIDQLTRSGSPGEPSGAPGSFKDSASDSRRSGFEVPDWLKGLIPDGASGFRKTSSELDFKPSPAVSGDRKVKSVMSAYSPAGGFLGVGAGGNSLFGERTRTTSTLYSDGTSTLKKGKTNVLFRATPDRNNALARLLENMG